jgi:hypothetical protein
MWYVWPEIKQHAIYIRGKKENKSFCHETNLKIRAEQTSLSVSVSDSGVSGEQSGIVPISDPTVINYIVSYLNNIFHDFGHLELVEHGESYVKK